MALLSFHSRQGCRQFGVLSCDRWPCMAVLGKDGVTAAGCLGHQERHLWPSPVGGGAAPARARSSAAFCAATAVENCSLMAAYPCAPSDG